MKRWGVRYIKLDFVDDAAIEGYHYRPDVTALEAQRIRLDVIRDAVGPHMLLDLMGGQREVWRSTSLIQQTLARKQKVLSFASAHFARCPREAA